MPSKIVQKHLRVTQDDTARIQAMEMLIGHFDRMAEAATRLAEQENRDAELAPV